ncbi:hypothetical protein J45TS6_32170 [Paenibacillus sp. J45TS6]|uniref:Uncharacterized protein n=1 Tax=Paenibacillus gallinarum TaxID=2762232 RepID=A0ABR8T6K2_9BACL|nr:MULTISPECIES: hypothetical protein [Paenibacillus]MBD7971376.1 hypothetical protein [Paenibacillus gallinarum]GIP44758.1 hypothetical protein J45TS6_32170 [Paenibacillus sp. J45TS6]
MLISKTIKRVTVLASASLICASLLGNSTTFASEKLSIEEKRSAVHQAYGLSEDWVNDLIDEDLQYYYDGISELVTSSVDENYFKLEEVYDYTLATPDNGYSPLQIVDTNVSEVSKQEAMEQSNNKDNGITTMGASTTTTSWLKLETSNEKYSTSQGGASARFEWLKTPTQKQKDVLALGTNSNMSVIPGTASNVFKYTYLDQINPSKVIQKTNNPVAFQSVLGYAYEMQLPQVNDGNSPSHPDYARNIIGYMKYRYTPNVSTLTKADIYAKYGHNITILNSSLSVDIKGTAGISIGPASKTMEVYNHNQISW